MKRILLAFLAALPFYTIAQDNTTKLDIWPDFERPPYAEQRVKGHDFKVVLSDLPNKDVIIGYHHSGKTFVKDTVATDDKGVAQVKGDEMWDGGIYLIAVDGASLFEFVYSATESNFTLETTYDKSLENLKIKNSPENQLFQDYQLERIKRQRLSSRLGKRYQEHSKAENKDSMKVIEKIARKNQKDLKQYQIDLANNNPGTMVAMVINLMREPEVPEPPALVNGEPVKDTAFWQYLYFKKHYWDYVDFTDDRIIRTPIFKDKVNKYIGQNLTVQMPDSICATALDLIDDTRMANKEVYKNVLTWVMSKYENSNIMGMNAVVCCLGNKYYRNDPECDWLKAKQKKKLLDHLDGECNVLVGNMAKDMVMLDITGVPRSLHGIDADYTIVYFYSATCGHCKKVTPKVKKIYDEYKDKGVKVFAVNTDYKEVKNDDGKVIDLVESKEYKDYVKENELDWINVADPRHETKFRDHYNIYSTPVIYLVDKNKTFVGVRLDWITLRKMLLNKVDKMPHEDIDAWMEERGYVPEEEDKEESDKEGEE
ncbi:MAG: redoxin domain-containing protein [Bacteroidia bacterium]